MADLNDHILVLLDASTLDESAVRSARELVNPGGRVTLLLTRSPSEPGPLGDFAASENLSVPDAAEIYVQRTVRRLRAEGVVAEPVSVPGGRTAAGVVWNAQRRGVTLILLAAEDRPRRKLFGRGLAQQLVAASPVPVLVAPRPGRRRDEPALAAA
ncbi:MAG: universal stress protein [Egibacteraceae bacterium]